MTPPGYALPLFLATHGTFLGLSGPEWHAVLNDFPPALLVASVVFDLAGAGKGRESLKAAGYWSLVGGAASALTAMISGLLVEERIEKSAAVHRLVETHETLGIALTILFVALVVWRIWRGKKFGAPEQQSYAVTSVAAVLALLWTAHVGGTMVYRHAAGIASDVLQTELRERAATAPRATER